MGILCTVAPYRKTQTETQMTISDLGVLRSRYSLEGGSQ